ncbi:hypothetical protein FA13DRAFT_262191 [Coprinellus micaceus]|uniref:Uncharacterized protein n=1 Tax=Coprinellus micaceus TaxID=71717 RepID=A0A4Y7SGG0_COPMI|nr:hypothetical protein FA13DRAFT_262191 [Coprinellus micaceus]
MEEILSYNLLVPESLFYSPYQHFGKYDLSDLSSSVVLEVCRRWMRIGDPSPLRDGSAAVKASSTRPTNRSGREPGTVPVYQEAAGRGYVREWRLRM